MAQETLIQTYYMAENDKKKILLSFPDQGAEVKSGSYVLQNEDLVLTYEDGRVCRLPAIPPAYRPVLQTTTQILAVENNKDSLVRAYDIKNAESLKTKRARKRL